MSSKTVSRPSAADAAQRSAASKTPAAVGTTPAAHQPSAATSPDGSSGDEVPGFRSDFLQILNEQGELHPAIAPPIPPDALDDELQRIHRAMVLTRKFDERMLTMQRQGRMGTFAPGFGQEATQIGQVYPLAQRDWFSPSYRSFGAQIWRGWEMERLLLLWDGYFDGFAPPEGVNDLPFSIVIGSHVPVAAGVAMGLRRRGTDAVMLTNFGDGAASQGAVAEAFNFAAVDRAPCVFVVENNGWAISTPTDRQSAVPELAARGPAYGMPAERVDGNDVLAVIAATTRAVERARSGDGPTLIETVTYRMGVHTTADDPKVYRKDDEVKSWEARCPILRLERLLTARGLCDDAGIQAVHTTCDQEVREARQRFDERKKAMPREVFDFVYANPQDQELERQKAEYLRKLDRTLGGSQEVE